MADARSLFQVVIEAVDRLSVPFERMSASVHRFDAPIREVGERLEHLSNVSGIERISERFGELRESIGGAAEKLAEFVGPFAILAGAGSVAGLVELANKVAENGERIHDAAIKVGVDAESLQKLEFGAKLNSVPVETMEKALTRLNRTVADAAAGKNKDAAAMFRHLGIDLRDANHHVLDAAKILPKLADAIQKNVNPAIRTRIEMAAMGRGGAEMTAFLAKGGAALEDYGKQAEKAGIMTNEQVAQAKEFADASQKLRASVEGVANAIGGALFPVLQPVIDRITGWVQANRQLIATKVHDTVEKLAQALKKVDWHQVYEDTKHFVEELGHLIEKAGGAKTVLLVLGGIMVGPFLASVLSITSAVIKLGAALAPLGLGVAAAGLSGIASLALKIGLGAEALAGMTTAVPLLSGALTGLSGVFAALGAAIEATPVGWILTGIAAIGIGAYEVIKHWSKLKEYLGEFLIFVTEKLAAAARFVIEPWLHVADSFKSIWDSIAGIFDAGWAHIKPIVDALADNRVTRFLGWSGNAPPIGGVPVVTGNGGDAGSAAGSAAGGALGAPGPNGRVDGAVRVDIHLNGAPAGTRTVTRSEGQVKPSVNVGWNMQDAEPAW